MIDTKKSAKKLALNKESIRELTASELARAQRRRAPLGG